MDSGLTIGRAIFMPTCQYLCLMAVDSKEREELKQLINEISAAGPKKKAQLFKRLIHPAQFKMFSRLFFTRCAKLDKECVIAAGRANKPMSLIIMIGLRRLISQCLERESEAMVINYIDDWVISGLTRQPNNDK